MEKFYLMTGIRHIKTSVYHPETDGMVERFNATMKQTLRKLVDKSMGLMPSLPDVGLRRNRTCLHRILTSRIGVWDKNERRSRWN